MKKLLSSLMLAGSLGLLAGCPAPVDNTKPDAGETPDSGTPTETEVVEVTGSITGDTTWTADKTYVLKSNVFVESGTLTIEPGTVVKGNEQTALVVTANAKINASGTKEAPIVFTSAQPEGERASGNWSGLVLLGRAPINVAGGKATIEGFVAGADARTEYGGTNAAHDCGTLKYVRIEFTGYRLLNNSELQGLTAGGCGSETDIDYVHVHKSLDDGIEMFGGNANLKHIVITGADDDGLDWDQGYQGKVQFLVVQQPPEVGNNGFESDNNSKGFDLEPRSNPEIWNATLIGRATGGTEKSIAMTLRVGTAGKLNNLVVAHFGDNGIDVADKRTAELFNAGELQLKNSIFWDLKGMTDGIPHVKNPKKDDAGNVIEEDAAQFNENEKLVLDTTMNNRVVDPMLTDAKNVTSPNFAPMAGSPALNADRAGTPPAGGFFDATARFAGAIGTEDWTAGWTAYPEN